ncbi:hypothetical protein F5880DRAFT_75490 [Lentinula raphanica]|nr:hypothetical protein F5880DRAFT_75490 [Lentinula raphanica]
MKCTSASALILASFATSAYAAPGFLVERNVPSIPSTPNTPTSVSFSSFLPHDERDGAPRPSELEHSVLKSRQLAAGEDEEDIRSPSEDGRPQNSPAAVDGGLAVPTRLGRHRKSSSTSRPYTNERVDDATSNHRNRKKEKSSSRKDPYNLDSSSSTSNEPQTPGCSRCGHHRHFHHHDPSTWTLRQKSATEETPTTKAGEDRSKSGRGSMERKKPRSKSSASPLDVFNSQQAGSLMFNQHLNPPSTTTVGTNVASGNTNGPTTSTSGSGDISTGSVTGMNAPFWN